MTKVIVKEGVPIPEVYNGQIREDRDGRIVMVITDHRYYKGEPITETARVLVLHEGKNGDADKFTTIPQIFKSNKELVKEYPKVLSGTITIGEE